MISVIIPCNNEEENIKVLAETLVKIINKHGQYEIIFIDDGSTDNTFSKIKLEAADNSFVKYLSFSRNFGHQNALKAGFDFAKGDCVISIDADMQHPPELIDSMIEKWKEGFEIVYTVRGDDKDLSYFKRKTSKLFYKFLNYFSDIRLSEGVADYRLLDKKVIEVFRNDIHEYNLFVRGLISWIGFKQFAIHYIPQKRHAGKTKYSTLKMINFALNGITSFSIKPLRIAVILGFIISFFTFLYGLYAIAMALFTDKNVSGWTSLIFSVLFIGGIQLIFLGIIGEYIGKMFFEVKKRPNYIIKDTSINK